MRISTFFYILTQGIRNVFRNKWFSLASIATISACLFLFGLFYSILINFRHMILNAEQGVSVTVFFDENIDAMRIQEIGDLIDRRAEVADKVFVSDDEAWDTFKVEYLGEYSDGFTENPLEGMDNYQIYLSDVTMQDSLVTYLESLQGVRKVNKSADIADMLGGINLMVGYVSVAIIIILFAVSIFLINNTVIMGISIRKEEINIMKYIGATDFFVRAPFVIESIIIGLIGSAIPLGIIYNIYNAIITYVTEKFSVLASLLVFLPVSDIFRILVPVSLGIGAGIGFLGSIVTVRRHLQV